MEGYLEAKKVTTTGTETNSLLKERCIWCHFDNFPDVSVKCAANFNLEKRCTLGIEGLGNTALNLEVFLRTFHCCRCLFIAFTSPPRSVCVLSSYTFIPFSCDRPF